MIVLEVADLTQARPASAPGGPAAHAAVLHALMRQRPLRRGNQQVALAAMLQFLALNGQELDPDPPGPIAAMVTRVAADTLDIKEVADWLAPRLCPGARAGIRTRPKDTFTRFTDRARRAVVLAQHQAISPAGRRSNSGTLTSAPSTFCYACSPRATALSLTC